MPTTVIKADVEKVLAKAVSQKGTTEAPRGSNNTPYGKWFGLNGNKWSAMFVSWSFAHTGFPLPPVQTSKGYALCSLMRTWAKDNSCWVDASKTPERGDIVIFSLGGQRPDHTGIVLGVLPNGLIHTIEGNVSDTVGEHRRAKDVILGYVSVGATGARASAQVLSSRVLNLGDKDPGADGPVHACQRALNQLRAKQGQPPLVVDGDYGKSTKAAVKAFQKFANDFAALIGQPNRLVVDGEYGPKTQGSLLALIKATP